MRIPSKYIAKGLHEDKWYKGYYFEMPYTEYNNDFYEVYIRHYLICDCDGGDWAPPNSIRCIEIDCDTMYEDFGVEKDINGLKPCPFCWGQGHIINNVFDDGEGTMYVECKKCGSEGESFLFHEFDENSYQEAKQRAISAWNKRIRETLD